MARVLVTGASGRVGANVVAELRRRGHRVRAMVIPADPARAKLEAFDDLEIADADLGDAAAIHTAVGGVDVVVHLAAQMLVGGTAADRYFDTNTLGTVRLLEAAVAHGVQRFVLASTDGTYDVVAPRYLPIDEQHPQLPGDRYGTSKLLSEVLVHNYAKQWDLDTAIVRFGSVVAVDEVLGVFRLEFVRGLLERAAQGPGSSLWPLLKGREDVLDRLPSSDGNPAVVLRGPDGDPWALHLTDVRDTVTGTILAVERPEAVGDAFNVVGPAAVTCAESAEVLSAALGIDVVDVEMPVTWAFEVSYEKARRVLGYEPEWTYRRMVESALAHDSGLDVGVIPVIAR